MDNKIFSKFILFFALFLTMFAPVYTQTQNSPDIPALLREVKQKSDENWLKYIREFSNYTYKGRGIWRTVGDNGKIKEESNLTEVFYPAECRTKKCGGVLILLAQDRKPLSSEKIEKQRTKAVRTILQMEGDEQKPIIPPDKNLPLTWMQGGHSIRRPNPKDWKLVAYVDGQEILEKCEFFNPARETINGRETIALTFRPRSDVVFSENTKYMPLAEGKIWIDAQDKVLMQLAVWQKGAVPAEFTSDYLREHAPMFVTMTLVEGNIWFNQLWRISGLSLPNFFPEMKGDRIYESFDYHRFKTEIKSVETTIPIKLY